MSTMLAVFIAFALALALSLAAGFIAWRAVRRAKRLTVHARSLVRHRGLQTRRVVSMRRDFDDSRQRLRAHLSGQPAAVACVTPGGRILHANKAMVAMLAYGSEAELCSQPAEVMYANPAERASRVLTPLAESGEIKNAELDLRRRDGVPCRALVSIRVMEGAGGERLHEAVFTDITEWHRAVEENRKLADQLHVSQKLEAVGRLASGIAHEINTPVHFVLHNLHFLREAFDALTSRHAALELMANVEDSPDLVKAREELGAALSEAALVFEESFEGLGRVAETVQAMKDFAHPGDGEMAPADLTTDLASLPSVTCRLGDIKKLLLNLIVNAAHAIEARPAGSPRGSIHIETRAQEKQVIVRVSDTGCGIPKAVLERIFDPFFTTKPLGKGTGQGLAIARSAARSHGGSLDVASTVGVGTTFTLRLPLHETGASGSNLFEEFAEESIS